MRLTDRAIEHYLRLSERSRTTRTILIGIIAFVFTFGIDVICHEGGMGGWLGERLIADILEAIVLAVIASYLWQRQEERILRRHKQVQYLNHHVRNALAVLKMLEQHMEANQACAVDRASERIGTVIEQVARDEDVSIDERNPEAYRKAA